MRSLVAHTAAGPVGGLLSDGVASFKGIPYAAPPFGPNRFQAPRPPQPWRETRDATAYGVVPPQSPYPEPFRQLLGDAGETGEDCLNLNVWTPDMERGGLPVMVWIHGGAFLRGSGAVPVYDGSHFARDGIVCVTINYRLGADGFLWLEGQTANAGLLDQLAALRWVQDNIEAFGGDPRRVTIFGESAGAFSVATLIAIRESAGLFQRAILQSGAGHHVISTRTAQMISSLLAEKLAVEPTSAALAGVPIDRFVQAQAELALELAVNPDPNRWGEVASNGMLFEPVIDGSLLTQRPIDAIASGAGRELQLLVGTTSEEWRFFVVPNSVIDYLTDDHLTRAAAARGLDLQVALATYQEALPSGSAGDRYSALVTDWFFRIPGIRLAEAHQSNGGAAYLYEFAWRSPLFNGRLGACHAIELGFVFDNLDRVGPMRGERPPQELADAMHGSWVKFASTGDPGWPQYEAARRDVMRFDEKGSAVVLDPNGSTRRLWDGRR